MPVIRRLNDNNMTAYNNTMQTPTLPYTLLQPVIPGKQLTFKTPEEQAA